MSAGLEIRGAAVGLLDDPLLLRLRGGAGEEGAQWRARYRDDHGRVWRAAAESARGLTATWKSAKAGTEPLAALQSLRTVHMDVRAEIPDGRGCNRTVTRSLVGEGVRVRRWRDGLAGALYRPAQAEPCATVVIDATTGAQVAVVATLAAALLASRGVLVLSLSPMRRGAAADAVLASARERLLAVPGASPQIETLAVLDPLVAVDDAGVAGAVVLPPGVGVNSGAEAAEARATAWDALLSHLGAQPREVSGDSREASHAAREGSPSEANHEALAPELDPSTVEQ
jgi:hypothetical protein